jgi:hypothetical protein
VSKKSYESFLCRRGATVPSLMGIKMPKMMEFRLK